MSSVRGIVRTAQRLMGAPGRAARRAQWSKVAESGEPVDIRMPGGWVMHLYPEGQIAEYLFVGWFEQADLRLVSRFLLPKMNVIDIGANIGMYSIAASRLVGDTGRVWSFEPSQQTSDRLRANLALNECTNVEVIQKALSDTDGGHLTLRRDPGTGDGERYVCADSGEQEVAVSDPMDRGDQERVPITTLDAWWAGREARVDFIKIDVEGAEYAALRGAESVVAANPDVVVMLECQEKHCCKFGHHPQDVFDLLREWGVGVFAPDFDACRWSTDEDLLLAAENVWVCRDEKLLPEL